MSDKLLSCEYNTDSSRVSLTLTSEGAENLSARQIDSLMAELAAVRVQMVPQVPAKFPVGQPTHRHESTNYHFGFDPFLQKPILSLRSPGFGWLSFALPAQEIERIHRSLQELQKKPIVPPTGTTQ